MRFWGSWISRILDPKFSFHRGILEILIFDFWIWSGILEILDLKFLFCHETLEILDPSK